MERKPLSGWIRCLRAIGTLLVPLLLPYLLLVKLDKWLWDNDRFY